VKILYLKTGLISERDVLDTLLQMKFAVGEYNAPTENEKLSNDYAAGLLNKIESFKPDLVFCLRYYSAVSLVCNASKVKYIAWICKSYEPDIYSCTLLNECNYIFFADKSLADEFSGGGFKHIYFMPLGVNYARIESVINTSDREYDSDITMMQDIRDISEVDDTPLTDARHIKDSTKGYLMGCLACQQQTRGLLPPMAANLPDYVLDDLQLNYPPQINGDSIETHAHYYDYTYFNPLITYMQRSTYIDKISYSTEFENINLYTAYVYKEFKAEKVKVHEQADYYTQVPIIARNSKINVVVTHRNWQSAIPQISWDIMASGGFLISNIQNDFLYVFKDTIPIMCENRYDLNRKAKYYLNNESEREQMARELSEEVRDRHTYEKRIDEMFGKI
jgi:spore maturation protein CgeB